jgi:hypothetical protein
VVWILDNEGNLLEGIEERFYDVVLRRSVGIGSGQVMGWAIRCAIISEGLCTVADTALKVNVGGEAACWEWIEERRFSKPVEWLIKGRNESCEIASG